MHLGKKEMCEVVREKESLVEETSAMGDGALHPN